MLRICKLSFRMSIQRRAESGSPSLPEPVYRMNKLSASVLILILIITLLSACSFEESRSSAYYVIDPRFEELYQQLQGREILGPPISNKKYVAGTNLEKQYFEAAVLVYDPDSSPRYYLESIGYEAGFSDLPNADPENPNVRFVNGFIIPVEFAKLYDELGGSRWVGQPLTRARKNPEKGTVEQYFENLGFFRFEDDPPGTVRLMPYGLWRCAGECSKYPNIQNASVRSHSLEVQQSPFADVVARLGEDFTGQALSEPYRGEDRRVEQVFSHVVIVEDHDSGLGIKLRPAARLLDIQRDPPQSPEADREMYFREVEDGLGYYIPAAFIDFISRYSGFELSGEPISRAEPNENGLIQQCYENYCLSARSAGEDLQVEMVPLGEQYKQDITLAPSPTSEMEEERNIILDVWEQSPQISSQEQQQIGSCIHEGDLPLAGIQARLDVTIPGMGLRTYQLPQTDQGGCSFYTLEPIQAENGTPIDYQVCFTGSGGEKYCRRDSFLIWGNASSQDTLQPTATAEQPTGPAVSLDIWELSPQIPSHEAQEVGACIHEGDHPLTNLKAELMVNTPEEGILVYKTAPTDQGGCSFFKMEPIQAKNGETIPYQVCFTTDAGEKLCQRDSFLIWGNP